MDNIYFNLSTQLVDQNLTVKLLTSREFLLLRKCLVWMEMCTALTALAINSLAIAALMGNNSSCRGYFYGLLNLSLAQCLLSFTSITSVAQSLWTLDYIFSPSSSNDWWWRSISHNITLAIFSGLCVTGAAALSLTHWWSLNVWANHVDMPTGYRVVKVIFYVLWSTSIMFATWLNFLSTVWGTGLTMTIAENDEKMIQPCLRIYSMCLFVSTCLLVFSNVTSIPPVTGHLTVRAIQGNHRHDCRDADCVCSDSEADDTSHSRAPRTGNTASSSQSRDLANQQKTPIPSIPTIITLDDDEVKRGNKSLPTVENELQPINKAINLQPYPSDHFLSSVSSMDALTTVCNLSIYSADISTNSAAETLADSTLKLSIERLHRRLQQLNDTRPVPPPDPESPQSSFTTSKPVGRKRTKKKRKHSKKLKGVKRLQLECPNRVQVSVMLSFFFLYFPPWCLLLAGIYLSGHATVLLSLLRLIINLINSLNPFLQGFRHPRFALKMARTLRKIYPAINHLSRNTSGTSQVNS